MILIIDTERKTASVNSPQVTIVDIIEAEKLYSLAVENLSKTIIKQIPFNA